MTIVEPTSGAPLKESCIPVLETGRLVLRTPRIEDATAIAELANNRKIAEMTANLPYPYRPSDAAAFVHALATGPASAMDSVKSGAKTGAKTGAGDGATAGASFAVFLKHEGALALAGMCSFGTPLPETGLEIGYWVGEPFWGRGIATEAARAVIDYAFSETDANLLLGAARVVNPASRRVLEKCGFQWSGVGLCRIKALSASVPVDRFQLDRRIWASLRAWGAAGLPRRSAPH